MASYQDLDTRVEGLENAVYWLMREFFKVQVPGNPLSLAPEPKVISLLEFYRQVMAQGIGQAVAQSLTPDDLAIVVKDEGDGTGSDLQ